MVPHEETRQGTRTVCRTVPETTTRTVTRDCGRWGTQTLEVPCSRRNPCGGGYSCGCAPATRTVCRRVWGPNVTTEEVPVTTYRTVTEEVPYEYTEVVCRPEERQRTVKVCSYRTEERTRTVPVTRYRAETKIRMVKECSYETQTVPVQVQKEVQVRVCKMEPKTITVPCVRRSGGRGVF